MGYSFYVEKVQLYHYYQTWHFWNERAVLKPKTAVEKEWLRWLCSEKTAGFAIPVTLLYQIYPEVQWQVEQALYYINAFYNRNTNKIIIYIISRNNNKTLFPDLNNYLNNFYLNNFWSAASCNK